MAIDVAPPIAGAGGAGLLVSGGVLAAVGRRQLQASADAAQFVAPARVMPTLREFQTTLAATDEMLSGVQDAMQQVRLPGKGVFARIPFIGNAADDLERAARIGAAASRLSRIDEAKLVDAARSLNGHTTQLVTALEADALRIAPARAGALGGGGKLLAGGALAAAGALLVATTVFDVG